jgi:hypothetical protein|tara:strand:+ start:2249 stop:2716 length:468 start_codon:yes stop_codon:yes gene_type:complete
MAGGRPPFAWTDEIEAEIFERIANGESTRSICNDDWLPSWGTLNKRLASDPEFVARYARAREDQADKIFEEILTIADDAHNDWMERNGKDDAGWQANGEHIQRSKLRIDARKWMAGKLRPKVYGDKLELNARVDVTTQTKEQRDAAVAAASRADR